MNMRSRRNGPRTVAAMAGHTDYTRTFTTNINNHTGASNSTGFAATRDGFLRGLITDPRLRLNPTQIRVGVLLGLYTNHEKFKATGRMLAWPSVRKIGDLLELKTSTVVRALDELIRLGLIEIDNRNRFLLTPRTCGKSVAVETACTSTKA